MKKSEFEVIRPFFVSLTSKSIQNIKCLSMDTAFKDAKEIITEQEDMIKVFIDRFCESFTIDSQGAVLITKPIKHELYHDKEPSQKGIYKTKYPYIPREGKYEAGRATIRISIETLEPVITFENPDFIHGHLMTNGKVGCWGKFQSMSRMICTTGPITALSSMYNFCKMSRYGTRTKQEELEYAGK